MLANKRSLFSKDHSAIKRNETDKSDYKHILKVKHSNIRISPESNPISTEKFVQGINKQKNRLDDLFSTASTSELVSLPKDEKINDDLVGTVVEERYQITGCLGLGSFGTVVEAYDRQTEQEVALKIVKNEKNFVERAKVESKILKNLNLQDENDAFHIVRLFDSFSFGPDQSFCLVFEKLSISLYDLLKSTDFDGVSLRLTRLISRQILIALSFLSYKEIGIIHCDLKPENILLCDAKQCKIKLIDFGSACKGPIMHSQHIQSRFYRAPEIIFGIPFTRDADLWSFACISYELFSGVPLFKGKDEIRQLVRMYRMLGAPSDLILTTATKNHFAFERDSKSLVYDLKPRYKETYDSEKIDLYELIAINVLKLSEDKQELIDFTEFLQEFLCYEPKKRKAPLKALTQLPFMTKQC